MRDRSVSTEDGGTRSGKREIGVISVRSMSSRCDPEVRSVRSQCDRCDPGVRSRRSQRRDLGFGFVA